MQHWVARCESCGFCASSVATVVPEATLTIAKPEYLAQLSSPDYPELANSFLCEAQLLDAAGLALGAANSALSAAWVCDDLGLREEAAVCRKTALAYGTAALAEREEPEESDGIIELVLADVARRAGEFATAVEWCDAAKAAGVADVAADVEAYERHLCVIGDTAAHAVSDVDSFESTD
jgi:hypothetical protein